MQGLGDDVFNLSCLYLNVKEVSQTNQARIKIQQDYKMGIPRIRKNNILVAYHKMQGVLLGESGVRDANIVGPARSGMPSPEFDVELDKPIAGLDKDSLMWNVTTANPRAIIRNCRLDGGSRFRSPVRIEGCQVNGLLWFTGLDHSEAPLPRDVVVKDSVLRLGSGNPTKVVAVGGPNTDGIGQAIQNVTFENNRVYGDIDVADTTNLLLKGNTFQEDRKVELKNVREVKLLNNSYSRHAAIPVPPPPGIRSGRLFKMERRGEAVFFSMDGKYYLIPNPVILNRIWPPSTKQKIEIIPEVREPSLFGRPLDTDAKLVKVKGRDAVYFLHHGQKRLVLRPEFLQAFGPPSEPELSQTEIDAFPLGDDIYDSY